MHHPEHNSNEPNDTWSNTEGSPSKITPNEEARGNDEAADSERQSAGEDAVDVGETMWSHIETRRYYLVPNSEVLSDGDYPVFSLTRGNRSVNATQIAAFEVTKEQAAEWLRGGLKTVASKFTEQLIDSIGKWRAQHVKKEK